MDTSATMCSCIQNNYDAGPRCSLVVILTLNTAVNPINIHTLLKQYFVFTLGNPMASIRHEHVECIRSVIVVGLISELFVYCVVSRVLIATYV